MKVFLASLFATPAFGVWFLPEGEEGRANSLLRGGMTLFTAALFLFLLIYPLSWRTATFIWLGFLLVASSLIGIMGQFNRNTAEKKPGAEGWARNGLAVFPILFFAAVPVAAVTHLLVVVITGRWLVRTSFKLTEPATLFSSIFGSSFLLWILAGVFVLLSLRGGHLLKLKDIIIALFTWIFLLFMKTFLINGLLVSFVRSIFGVEMSLEFSSFRLMIAGLVFIIALIPLALVLAWGRGSFIKRCSITALAMVLAVLSLFVTLGMVPWAECVWGKHLERGGNLQSALSWYGRSLERRSTPLIVSYLQHRIGLINYKLGHYEGAITSLKLLQTRHDANPALVAEANTYLDRLLAGAKGKRVVLPGVETVTEYRPAYCAPNTLSLVFRYLGTDIRASEVGEQIALIYGGSMGSNMALLCDRLGYDHILIPFTQKEDWEFIIDRGYPILAYIPGHVLAIFGYDTRLDTLIAYDTATWDIWVDHPVESFLTEWSHTNYLGAVVLPRNGDEKAKAIRERYATPGSQSAWYTWLAMENPDGEVKRRYALKALDVDPGYLPAAALLAQAFPAETAQWGQSSWDASIEEANDLIGRTSFENWGVITALGRGLLKNGRWSQVVALHDHLTETGRGAILKGAAGNALTHLGERKEALHLLLDAGNDLTLSDRLALAETQEAMGLSSEAVNTYADLIHAAVKGEREEARGEIADLAVGRLDELATKREAAFHIRTIGDYLALRPDDTKHQIAYAHFLLTSVEEGGKNRRETLLSARKAATMAILLTEDPEVKARAEEIIEKVKSLIKG